MDELVLASGSPQRRRLMARLGPFRAVTPAVDESFDPDLSPEAVARLLARRKAEAVAGTLTAGIVVGADTVVALGREVIGKPRDRADAVRILSRLSATRQAVITAVCVIHVATGRRFEGAEVTWVTMRRMSASEIAAYVESGEADGKAGAYAIQEAGDRFVEKVEGDFDNAVGLPVRLVARLIEAARAEEGP